MPGKIEVVNAKTFCNFDPVNRVFYIGRFNSKWGFSHLHNRWSHYPQSKATHVATREESIAKFKEWFLGIQERSRYGGLNENEYNTLKEFNFLKHIFSQTTPDQTLYLVCWCAPKPCHGDFLRELLLQSASL